MCRLALVDWMTNHLGNSKKDLLYAWIFAYSEEELKEAEKAIFKEKLWESLDALLRGLRAIYPGFMTQNRRISGRADYYLYFYLYGLSLLADRGTFCFITSNSWLDVDFGKDLQEFFLRHSHLKMVIDNRAKRSFAQADVNTVIVLAGPPERKSALKEKEMQDRKMHFVAFQVPFEEALNPVLFSEIEDDRLYEPLAGSQVLKRKEFRAVLQNQWSLYEEGLEEAAGKRLVASRKYAGSKWGGKYLRAPDIFFTILEKGKDKLVRLGEIAEVRAGIITGVNKLYYRPVEWPIPKGFSHVFKSPREVNRIVLRQKNSLTMIKIQGVPFRIKRAPLLWPDLRNDKHIVHINANNLPFEHNFYGIVPLSTNVHLLGVLLNCTLTCFLFEIFTRTGLGGGAARLVKIDIVKFPLLSPTMLTNHAMGSKIFHREIRSVFEELGFTLCHKRRCQHQEHPYEFVQPEELTLEQVRTASPDRFSLDEVVFDALSLTEEERLQVYQAVVELVKNRLVKARSV